MQRLLNCLVIITISMAVSLIINTDISQAGGINGDEARIIGAASGSFEYDGEIYVAKQEYINQLSGYLSKDGVDLTAAQADKAISKIYSSVATGVRHGYIVKAGTSNNSSENTETTDGDDTKEAEEDIDDESGKKSGKTDGKTDKSGTDSTDKADKNNTSDATADSDKPKADNSMNSVNSEGIEPGSTPVPPVIVTEDGTTDVYDNSGNSVASIDGVMKNTGYSLYNTIIVIGVIAMILLFTIVCGIILIRRNNMIAGKDNAVRP